MPCQTTKSVSFEGTLTPEAHLAEQKGAGTKWLGTTSEGPVVSPESIW